MIKRQQMFVCQRKESRRKYNIGLYQNSEIQIRDLNFMHVTPHYEQIPFLHNDKLLPNSICRPNTQIKA